MSQLWPALEQFWGLSASRLSWQLQLGNSCVGQYDLLAPTHELAYSLPVAGKPYEWLEISEFDEGVFEGYNEKTEEDVPVDRSDMVCYEFSVAKLGKILGDLVGFGLNVEHLEDTQHCFLLGQFGGTAGAGFAFYFAKMCDPRRLKLCLNSVQLKDQRPYVLFLTSTRMLSSECSRMLSDKGCLCLPLEQSLVCDEEGWALAAWARKQLVEFRDRVLPKPQDAVGKFPTPPGCTWKDVEIHFQDAHTVTLMAGGRQMRLMYSQMGLASSKNGKPLLQWEFLYSLAENHGIMTWDSPGARRGNRKQREFLNKSLRAFFGIDGDPIAHTDDEKGYRCVFKLVPAGNKEHQRVAAELDDD